MTLNTVKRAIGVSRIMDIRYIWRTAADWSETKKKRTKSTAKRIKATRTIPIETATNLLMATTVAMVVITS